MTSRTALIASLVALLTVSGLAAQICAGRCLAAASTEARFSPRCPHHGARSALTTPDACASGIVAVASTPTTPAAVESGAAAHASSFVVPLPAPDLSWRRASARPLSGPPPPLLILRI